MISKNIKLGNPKFFAFYTTGNVISKKQQIRKFYAIFDEASLIGWPCFSADDKVVDLPTQLICIWIFICQHSMKKDIAG